MCFSPVSIWGSRKVKCHDCQRTCLDPRAQNKQTFLCKVPLEHCSIWYRKAEAESGFTVLEAGVGPCGEQSVLWHMPDTLTLEEGLTHGSLWGFDALECTATCGTRLGCMWHSILCHDPRCHKKPCLELPVWTTKYIFPLKYHPIGTTCLHTAVTMICSFLLWMEARPFPVVNEIRITK